jgi:hypothetical protein
MITRLVSGELPRSAREELEVHLRDCPSCREDLLLAEELEALLDEQAPAPAPHGLSDRIMTAVDLLEREIVEAKIVEIAKGRQKLIFGKDVLPYLVPALFTSIVLIILWSPLTELLSAFTDGIPWERLTTLLSLSVDGSISNVDALFVLLSLLFSLFLGLGRPVPVYARWRDALPF